MVAVHSDGETGMSNPNEEDPELAHIAANPSAIQNLPDGQLLELLAELERLRARLWWRLNRPPGPQPDRNGSEDQRYDEDQLLDVERVAEIMAVDKRYVYDHADDWPFTRRISPRKLRFSKKGLFGWLETRS